MRMRPMCLARVISYSIMAAKVFGVLRDFAVKHPRWIGVPLVGVPGAFWAVTNIAYWWKTRSIDAMLEAGTKPPMLRHTAIYMYNIDRSAVIDRIRDSFVALPKGRYDSFGVVLGPTGSGKTDATRKACNGKQTAGVLYCEVKFSKLLGKDLAKTIGMSLEPTGLIDLWLSVVSDNYKLYYELPDDSVAATSFVLDILAERAKKYQKKHGHVPCLFIDGIDLVAKDDSHAFVKLVELAKIYANRGDLRIVFLSSEGRIVPLMKTTSSSSRSTDVVEVLDMSDDAAKDFLIDKGMSKNQASQVVGLTGGRLIHVIQAVETNKYYYPTLSEDDRMKKIELVLFEKNVRDPLISLQSNSTIGEKIVKYILSNGDTDPVVIRDVLEDNDEAVVKTIESLVQANLFRYTAKGLLSWHSPLVHNAVLTRMK